MNLSLLLLFLSLTFALIYLCGCLNLSYGTKEGFESKPIPQINLLKRFKELSKESFQEVEDLNPCPNIKLTKKEDDDLEEYQYCLEFPDTHIKRCYSKEKKDKDITPFMLAYTAFGDLWVTTPKNKRNKCIEEKKDDIAKWWLCDPVEIKKIENNPPTNPYSKEIHNSLKGVCRLE
jgi:hypothetical protein